MKNTRWVRKEMDRFERQFKGLDEGMWPVRKWFKAALYKALKRGTKNDTGNL